MKLSSLLLLTTLSALPSLHASTQMMPDGATTPKNIVETFQPVTVNTPNPVNVERSQSPKIAPQHTSLESAPADTHRITINTDDQATQMSFESAPTDTHRITINTNDQAPQVLPNESSDWTKLRNTATVCSIAWCWTLYSYYSQYFGVAELWQSKGARNSAATGYPDLFAYWFILISGTTGGTFHFALKYFKINWLTPELYISSVKPYVGLFCLTMLSAAILLVYDIHFIISVIHSITGGLWLSFMFELQDRYLERRKIQALAN